MTALVSVETVMLVVLLLLVAGLLRSNAEILRRLGPPGAEASGATIPQPPVRAPAGERPAAPLSGPTPSGDAVTLDLGAAGSPPTLLAFLTSGCSTCAGFWETLGEPRLPPEIQTVIVTHGAERERPRRLAALAPAGVPGGHVLGGLGGLRRARIALLRARRRRRARRGGRDELAGAGLARPRRDRGSGDAAPAPSGGRGGSARTRRIDEVLAASGIGPGHPSLYPGAGPAADERRRP